jgi:hypothetical protein
MKITPKLIVRIEMSESKIRSTSEASPYRDQFEIRNNIKIQIFQFSKHVWDFGHLIFRFVSHFDIRISDLRCRFSGHRAIG